MSKWMEELKERADIWRPVDTPKTDSTSSYTSEPLCVQDIVTVEIPKVDLDRMIAIVEGAEWGSLNATSYEPICPLCRNIEREGHKTTCEYHEDWTP